MNKKVLTVSIIALLAVVFTATAQDLVTPGVITLTTSNLLTLDTEVTPTSVANLVVKARELDKRGDSPIYLVLNTPGGDIPYGSELIDNINSLHRPVHTVTLFAASMGFQIAQGLGIRYITNHGELMSHRASGGFQGSFGGKPPSQMDARYSLWIRIMNEFDAKTVERTVGKQTLESYQAAYATELWLTAQDAVRQGYADEITKVRCNSTLSGTSTHHTTYMGLEVTYKTDLCPVNTGVLEVKVAIPTNKGSISSEEFRAKGGQFGPSCIVASVISQDLICAMDTTLNDAKIEAVKAQFVDTIKMNKDNAIPFKFQ